MEGLWLEGLLSQIKEIEKFLEKYSLIPNAYGLEIITPIYQDLKEIEIKILMLTRSFNRKLTNPIKEHPFSPYKNNPKVIPPNPVKPIIGQHLNPKDLSNVYKSLPSIEGENNQKEIKELKKKNSLTKEENERLKLLKRFEINKNRGKQTEGELTENELKTLMKDNKLVLERFKSMNKLIIAASNSSVMKNITNLINEEEGFIFSTVAVDIDSLKNNIKPNIIFILSVNRNKAHFAEIEEMRRYYKNKFPNTPVILIKGMQLDKYKDTEPLKKTFLNKELPKTVPISSNDKRFNFRPKEVFWFNVDFNDSITNDQTNNEEITRLTDYLKTKGIEGIKNLENVSSNPSRPTQLKVNRKDLLKELMEEPEETDKKINLIEQQTNNQNVSSNPSRPTQLKVNRKDLLKELMEEPEETDKKINIKPNRIPTNPYAKPKRDEPRN